MSDTRYPSVEPDTAAELDAFLEHTERMGDDVTFEVSYGPSAMDDEFVTAIERSDVRRPSGGPVFRFVARDGETNVGPELVERVVARTGALGRDDYDAETPAGVAAEMAEVAGDAPELVDPADAVNLLDECDEEGRGHVWRTLDRLCETRPEDCTVAVETFVRELAVSGDYASVAGTCLRRVGNEVPSALVPWADAFGPLVAEDGAVGVAATAGLMRVAREAPTAVVDYLPQLETVVEDRTDRRRANAVHAMANVAYEAPEHLAPSVPTLVDRLADADADSVVVSNVAIALGHLIKEFGSLGGDGTVERAADAAATHVSREGVKARNNAVGLLADIAVFDVAAVRPHVDDVAELLSDEDDFARTNASAVVARVADHDADAVAEYVETFVELLDDEDPSVRTNACWFLGSLAVPAGRERLETLRSDDEAEKVRERAAWALSKAREAGR